jgi:hypothetical protein
MGGTPLYMAVSTMDLEPGTTVAVPVFDLMAGSTSEARISVEAAETVTLSSGDVETVRVSIRPADGSSSGSTLWFRTSDRRLVKAEIALPPQMGGGKVDLVLAEGG